jgi:hypothetical protein
MYVDARMYIMLYIHDVNTRVLIGLRFRTKQVIKVMRTKDEGGKSKKIGSHKYK